MRVLSHLVELEGDRGRDPGVLEIRSDLLGGTGGNRRCDERDEPVLVLDTEGVRGRPEGPVSSAR